jgi:hypothetical protein
MFKKILLLFLFNSGFLFAGMTFEGTNYLTIPNNTYMSSYNAISFGGWFKWTVNTSDRYLMVKGSENYALACFSAGAGAVYLVITTADGSSYPVTTRAMNNGTWVHLMGVFDSALSSSQCKLYTNGILAVSADLTGKLSVDPWDMGIGASGGGDNKWIGSIFDIRIYRNVALSADEVLSICRGQGSDKITRGLVFRYKLTDGQDGVRSANSPVIDSSGYGNNATPVRRPKFFAAPLRLF